MVKVKEDLTGREFERLTVIKQVEDYVDPHGNHSARWLCECGCKEHNQVIITGEHLKDGTTKSCGCIRKEFLAKIKNKRLGKERYNYQNCLMRIVEYNNNIDIIIEFQDKYKARVHSTYQAFCDGKIKNPYFPSVCNVGITGYKYPIKANNKLTKEYDTWKHMLRRCFDSSHKEKHPEYKDVNCCEEWLLYENFYEWLHNQPNFEKWITGIRWAIDKDILVKGNKIYSPETCCLVPQNVNSLFTKRTKLRGNLPIGIGFSDNHYRALCKNPFTNKQEKFGYYSTPEDAFYLGYKPYKENIIKQVAQTEFNKGNISRQCYEAMLNYQVEITD